MDNKIAIVGANQGALALAVFAAKAGFEVSLYEAKQQKDMAYDWTDDMAPDTFSRIGLPMPPAKIYERKRNWSFIPPEKRVIKAIHIPENELDISVERRPLDRWLARLAEDAGAVITYGAAVKCANVDDNKVTGITLAAGETVEADLVVDCGGVNSAVRTGLPEIMHIQNTVKLSDTIFLRRTFFERPEGTKRPEHTNKAYLKHMEENGISWCLLSHDEKAADVLIGRMGELGDEVYNRALNDLKKENDIIGDKVLKGGQLLQIPVRHPLPRLVADGYVLLGDSACMTIPMLGSGLASGMRAAKILSEVIEKPDGERFSIGNLYRYQMRFMREIGGEFAAVDLMKNWLLQSKEGQADFLLESGVVTESMLKDSAMGKALKPTLAEMAAAGIRGRRRIPLLLQMVALLQKMIKERKIAENMPGSYDEEAFSKWEKKYEKAFEK